MEKALKIWRTIQVRNGEVSILNSIGLVYKDLEDYSKALSYFDQSLKIAETIGVNTDINCINIGDVHFALGSFDKAEQWYDRGGGGLIRYGLLALARRNYAKAEDYFSDSLKSMSI